MAMGRDYIIVFITAARESKGLESIKELNKAIDEYHVDEAVVAMEAALLSSEFAHTG
jgi:hypothetical protein